MAKILNLDAFATPTRQVTIHGVTYDLLDQTVGGYIQAKALQDEFDKMDNETRLHKSIEMLAASIKGISIETLHTLSFDQINVLTQFISGVDEPTLGDEPAEGDQKKA